ncbi:MAG TPA: hypothetical protein PKA22_11960 [Rhodocyclaceae bacterium]|nr:hypothetical protein [Rhodocyclaceae bacterium]HNM22212.1 hypothetical protein [Rhodocyclaceae bacterium]
MTDPLNTPLQASVFALDFIRVRGNEGWIALQPDFARRLAQALGGTGAIEAVRSPTGNPAFSVIVIDSQGQVLSPLRRIFALQDEIARDFPDCRLRLCAHHGVIFSSGDTYLGSALRVAHRKLEQFPADCLAAASSEFVAHAKAWGSRLLNFSALPGDSRGTLQRLACVEGSADPAPGTAPDGLVDRLTRLLARYEGPFAEILVEAASRTCRNPRQLVEEIAREIDRTDERDEFRREALAILESES